MQYAHDVDETLSLYVQISNIVNVLFISTNHLEQESAIKEALRMHFEHTIHIT